MVPTGFLQLAPRQPTRGAMFSARARLRMGGQSKLAAPILEEDLYRPTPSV